MSTPYASPQQDSMTLAENKEVTPRQYRLSQYGWRLPIIGVGLAVAVQLLTHTVASNLLTSLLVSVVLIGGLIGGIAFTGYAIVTSRKHKIIWPTAIGGLVVNGLIWGIPAFLLFQ